MPPAAIIALLIAATVMLRLPFLAPRFAHWDAVNYALGLHDFNIAAHQPHPPGSPYFILAGRAALALTGDDNSALLLLSVLASAGAVVGEYVLTHMLFGRTAAVLAAVFLMTHPVVWGYGTTATAWTVLAWLAVLVGTTCWLLLQGHRRLVLPSAVLMAVASGFRLDVTVFLAPLWAWAVSRVEPAWRLRLAAAALLIAGVLVWLIPVAAGAGGFNAWLARLLALLPSTAFPSAFSARDLLVNTAISFGTLAFTIGPALVLSLIANGRAAALWMGAMLRSATGVWLALWLLPSFLFLWLVDASEPGHALLFIGAQVAFEIGLLTASARKTWVLIACSAVIVALQLAVFLLARPAYGRPLAWTLDSMLLDLTAPGLRQQQTSLDSTLRTIRAQFNQDDSVVVTVTPQDPFRFMMYYLPEYEVVRVDPDAGVFLTARNRQQGHLVEIGNCIGEVADKVRQAWVVSIRSAPAPLPEGAILVSPAADPGPFQVWAVESGSSLGCPG